MRLVELLAGCFILGMVGIFGGILLDVMDSLGLTGDGALFIGNATVGMTNLASQLGLVGTVIGLSAVITILFAAFGPYLSGMAGSREI